MEVNKFMAKIEESRRCGADKVIMRLERFMRKRQMRLSDLFSTLDATGDGLLGAEELQVALEKEKLFLSDEEVRKLERGAKRRLLLLSRRFAPRGAPIIIVASSLCQFNVLLSFVPFL